VHTRTLPPLPGLRTTVDAAPIATDGWSLLVTTAAGVRAHGLPDGGAVVIGRGADCDVVLDDPQVSRRHARLQVGARCEVTDLGSRNRTTVRGAALAPATAVALDGGDSIGVGPFTLVLVPRAVSAVRTVLGGSSLLVDDPAAPPSPLLLAVATSPVSVLIRGETGVGKEVLSSALHRLSGRRGGFLRLNCAAFSEALLESELFGHERGAFTGATAAKPGLLEIANGGTVLLDEIGEMPPPLQAKVLRAIESREILRVGGLAPVAIDVRFVAATHRDLSAEVAAGRFRRDLLYRVAGITLEIPALRARRSRIAALALDFAADITRRDGAPVIVSAEALDRLGRHDWPGNARELRNVIERAALLAAGGPIGPSHLLFDAIGEPPAAPMLSGLDDGERARIVAALDASGGNQTEAARRLSMARSTLVHKLALHRIPRPRSTRSRP
jgi:two-component system response regulator AtoC